MVTELKDNPAVKIVKEHPYITTAALCLIALIATGGQITSPVTLWITGAGLIVLLTAFAVVLKTRGGLTFDARIVLIFAAGFIVRLFYVQYTDIATRQNDVGVFEEGVYNLFHSGYILYVRDNVALPSVDVREAGQFYHPPLHYVVCALFLKVYEFFPGGRHNYEALQILTLGYAQISAVIAYRILKMFDLKEDVLLPSAVIISLFPEFILEALIMTAFARC